MKLFITPLLIFLFSFLISGCQKEDVYNPKVKIESIYDYSISTEIPYISFEYNKGQLTRANLLNQSTFDFEYNNDNQTSAIYSFYDQKPSGYVLMSYIDQKLSKVEFFDHSNYLFQKDTFYRNHGDIYGYKSFIAVYDINKYLSYTLKSNLFQTYMQIQNPESVKMLKGDAKSELVLSSQTNVTYSKGNITQLETVYQNGYTTIRKFTYDSEKNPLYGLPFALIDRTTLPSAPLASYSKNNVVCSIHMGFFENPSSVIIDKYELDYQDQNYPSKIYLNKNDHTTLRWQFNYLD